MNRFVQFSLIALALNWPAWGQIQQSRTAQGARLMTVTAPQDRDDQAKRDQDDDDRRHDRDHRRHDRDDKHRRRARDRDRDQDRNRVYQDRDRDRDNDANYDRDNREYGRGSYGRNSQWRGRLSAQDQSRFDSYYSRWLGYRRSNNQSEAESMDRRMRDVYAHYGIPNNVPYNQVASSGAGPIVAY